MTNSDPSVTPPENKLKESAPTPDNRAFFGRMTLGTIHGCFASLWILQNARQVIGHYAKVNNIPSLMRNDVPKDAEGNQSLPDGRTGRIVRDARDPALGYVTLMCSMAAYTAELCLKRIACMTREDKRALKKHNLATLYDDLPWKTRQRLEDEFASTTTVVRRDRKTGRITSSTPERIKEICARHADVFPVARYMTANDGDSHAETVEYQDLLGMAGFLVQWITTKEGFQQPNLPPPDKTLKIAIIDKNPFA